MGKRKVHYFNTYLAEVKDQLIKFDLPSLTKEGYYYDHSNYYILGTYPPLKAMESVEADSVYRSVSKNIHLYVHIPFCRQRCTFCHFYKLINSSQSMVQSYIECLKLELKLVAHYMPDSLVTSIYIGGGTPSFLSPNQIEEVFDAVQKYFRLSDKAEITFEVHPAIVSETDAADRLNAAKNGGTNRWVIGLQSTDDEVLTRLNRGHSGAEFWSSLDLIRSVDPRDNVSIDLMYGLPLQSLEGLYETLIEVIDRGAIEKLNVFPLMFKGSDPITRQYRSNPNDFPNEETRLLMSLLVDQVLGDRDFVQKPLFYYSSSGRHSAQQEAKFDSSSCEDLIAIGVSGFGYSSNTQYFNTCLLYTSPSPRD